MKEYLLLVSLILVEPAQAQEDYDILYEGKVQLVGHKEKITYTATLQRRLDDRRLTVHEPGCTYRLTHDESTRWLGQRVSGPCPAEIKLFIRQQKSDKISLRSAGWYDNMTIRGELLFAGRADTPISLCKSPHGYSGCQLWSMDYASKDLLTSWTEKNNRKTALSETPESPDNSDSTTAETPDVGSAQRHDEKTAGTVQIATLRTLLTGWCDNDKLPEPVWSADSSLDHKAFAFFCLKPTPMDPPKWYLGLASTHFGHDVELTNDRVRAGHIIDHVSQGGFIYREIPEMLKVLSDLEPDHVAQLTLFAPEATKMFHLTPTKSKISEDYYFRTQIRHIARGAEPAPRVTYTSGNIVGDKIQMFASANWPGLERQLERDARAALEPLQSLLGNTGMALGAGALYRTRYARLITAYAIMRMNLHGSCGESTERVNWTTTQWTEYRNGFGHYTGSSATSQTREVFLVPLGFRAPFQKVDTISVDGLELRDLEEVVQELDCQNPARRIVEKNMLRFYHHQY